MSTAIERNILTVVEPAIMLDPMEMPDVESGDSGLGTIKEKFLSFNFMMNNVSDSRSCSNG